MFLIKYVFGKPKQGLWALGLLRRFSTDGTEVQATVFKNFIFKYFQNEPNAACVEFLSTYKRERGVFNCFVKNPYWTRLDDCLWCDPINRTIEAK